jgi:uncharacterized protein GlcG (DUF336 family)
MKKTAAAALCAAGFAFANPPPGLAQDVLTTHRLSAALAAEAVGEAVAACAKQGYHVTAAVVDTDGVTQALLRGDDASMTTLGAARDKAYTVLMLSGPRNEDTSSAIVQRMGAAPSAGGLAKLSHILAGRDQNKDRRRSHCRDRRRRRAGRRSRRGLRQSRPR